MTTSPGNARRLHHLALVALLAVVTPPSRRADDGRTSEHEVAPGMVIRCFVTASGERAFRLIVRGALVLHLTARDEAPPSGFSLGGEWLSVLETLAAPWRAVCDGTASPGFGPDRRSHHQRSPYGARMPSPPARLTGPPLVRFLAECAASLGSANAVDGDEMTLSFDELGIRLWLARIGADLHVLVHGGRRTLMAGTLSRLDLSRPGRMLSCIGREWLPELLDELRAASDQVDPADLVRFCQGI